MVVRINICQQAVPGHHDEREMPVGIMQPNHQRAHCTGQPHNNLPTLSTIFHLLLLRCTFSNCPSTTLATAASSTSSPALNTSRPRCGNEPSSRHACSKQASGGRRFQAASTGPPCRPCHLPSCTCQQRRHGQLAAKSRRTAALLVLGQRIIIVLLLCCRAALLCCAAPLLPSIICRPVLLRNGALLLGLAILGHASV